MLASFVSWWLARIQELLPSALTTAVTRSAGWDWWSSRHPTDMLQYRSGAVENYKPLRWAPRLGSLAAKTGPAPSARRHGLTKDPRGADRAVPSDAAHPAP